MGYISEGIVRPGLAAAIVTSSSSGGKWAPFRRLRLRKYDVPPLATGQVAELPAAPQWRPGLVARAIERLTVLRDRQKNDGIFDRDGCGGDGSMALRCGKNAESSAADTLVRGHAYPLKQPMWVSRRSSDSESSSIQSSRNSITLWIVL